jgi:2-polyprenyl-6-methoxyphenol hydroxylase-like FAD-dependent oxidoreductase
MAIEDAALLAECLSRFPGDVDASAHAYQSIREPRVRRIAEIAKGNGDIWVLPDGPDPGSPGQKVRCCRRGGERFYTGGESDER